MKENMAEQTTRQYSKIAARVDEAILIYESGEISEAMKMLSELGFSAIDVHRILLQPTQRRQYINNMITGY